MLAAPVGEASEPPGEPMPVQLESGNVGLPSGGGVLQVTQAGVGPGRLKAGLPPLTLRWRRGGERCKPSGRAHSQALKKLFQEYELPPWWRERIPLLYSEETLVAVPSLWVCDGFEAAEGEPGYRLGWAPEST